MKDDLLNDDEVKYQNKHRNCMKYSNIKYMKSGVRRQLKSGANRIMNIATVLCCLVGSMAEVVTEPVQDVMDVFNTKLGHDNTTDLLSCR